MVDFIQTNHSPPTSNISNEQGKLDVCVIPGAQTGIKLVSLNKIGFQSTVYGFIV